MSSDDAKKLLEAAEKVIQSKEALAKAQADLVSVAGLSSSPVIDDDHWSNYAEYNKTLRAWFVSFGIGAPALFLVNSALLEALRKSECGSIIVAFFIAGCGVQIFVAMLNKVISWHLYCGEREPEFKATRRYRVADFANSFLIDAIADLLTFLFFAVAVGLLLHLNLSEPLAVFSGSMPP